MKILHCLSVIMPVYNEARLLQDVVRRVEAVPLPKEIIMVDDGSTDGTHEILKNLRASEPNTTFKIIFHEKNQGKGASIRTGIGLATGDIVIIQDADHEYDPAEYPQLLEPLLAGDADVVYGSRYLNGAHQKTRFWHTLMNKFLTRFSNFFTGLCLSDMETCYKAFRTDIIKEVPLRSNRFGFEPEITAKLAKLKCRIVERPISYAARGYSEGKKINWKDGVSALTTILKFWVIDDLKK